MIIKSKDSNDETIARLQEWLDAGNLSPQIAKGIKSELGAIRRGAKGERECAFHLDGVIKDHRNRVIYERWGFSLLEKRHSADLTSYHLFAPPHSNTDTPASPTD